MSDPKFELRHLPVSIHLRKRAGIGWNRPAPQRYFELLNLLICLAEERIKVADDLGIDLHQFDQLNKFSVSPKKLMLTATVLYRMNDPPFQFLMKSKVKMKEVNEQMRMIVPLHQVTEEEVTRLVRRNIFLETSGKYCFSS